MWQRFGSRPQLPGDASAFESSVSANTAMRSSNLSLRRVEQKRRNRRGVKDWEIVADNLSRAGWS
jgi:hypothetical protein